MEITYLSGRMTEKRGYVLACAEFFANELKIKNSRTRLTFVTARQANLEGVNCYGATTRSGDEIYVYVNLRLGMSLLTTVIAHEMIHVAQFARGHLVKTFDGDEPVNFWCGKKIDQEVDYDDLPWEQKAYAQQEDLVNKLYDLTFNR